MTRKKAPASQQSWPKTIEVALVDLDADGLLSYVLACWANTDGKLFPGLAKANVVFEPDCTVFEQKYREMLQDGSAIGLDIGGVWPDHHPHTQFPGQCSFSHIIDYAGLGQDPIFAKMAKDATHWDSQGGGQQVWAIVNSVCKTNAPKFLRSNGTQRTAILKELIGFAQVIFDAWLEREKCFWDDELTQALNHGIVSKDGKRKAVVVHSDSFMTMDRAEKEGFAITAQATNDGRIFVRANKDSEGASQMIDDCLRVLRAEVTFQKGQQVSADELLCDGALPQCPEVYFAKQGGGIFIGGSPRLIGQKPSWDDKTRDAVVTNALTLAINPNAFPQICPGSKGEKGCLQNKCPLHRSQLPRCKGQGLKG